MARDRAGTALTEFAILLPVLLLLFVGGYQMSDASACRRRVTIAARAMADLVSQYDTLTATDVDAILTASTQIMLPYSAANSTMRVTEVKVNATGTAASVTWSRPLRMAALASGSSYTGLPTALMQPNTSYIISEMAYNYDPKVAGLIAPLSFSQKLYMLPRKSDEVNCASC